MNHLMKAEVSGYEIIEKIVKQSGNSGRVYVPIDWVGKKVKIVLLDPVESETGE
jgi:putative transposon-encoded protein